jgi:hypothetical protein
MQPRPGSGKKRRAAGGQCHGVNLANSPAARPDNAPEVVSLRCPILLPLEGQQLRVTDRRCSLLRLRRRSHPAHEEGGRHDRQDRP